MHAEDIAPIRHGEHGATLMPANGRANPLHAGLWPPRIWHGAGRIRARLSREKEFTSMLMRPVPLAVHA